MRGTITHTLPPKARPRRAVLTPHEWAEMRDALTLALDALGDGPEQVDRYNLLACIANQRIGLQIAHGRMERMK